MIEPDELTVSEIDLMKHCIGFDKNKVTGTKHRFMHAYRNRFYCEIDREWERIRAAGLAERGKMNKEKRVYYWLSPEGFAFLAKLCGLEKIVETN